jgi:hypothetical protein
LSISEQEVVVAPTIKAAVAEAVKPAEAPVASAPVRSGLECTRDTRGEADCAIKDCENCN